MIVFFYSPEQDLEFLEGTQMFVSKFLCKCLLAQVLTDDLLKGLRETRLIFNNFWEEIGGFNLKSALIKVN